MPRPERYDGEHQDLRFEYMQQQSDDLFHRNPRPRL